MSANWYFTKDGHKRVGPFAFDQLKQLAASGVLEPNDMVWNEEGSKWVSAFMVPGLLEVDDTTPNQVAEACGPAPRNTQVPPLIAASHDFSQALKKFFPPVKAPIKPILYGAVVSGLAWVYLFKDPIISLFLPLVCVTGGAVAALLLAHAQPDRPKTWDSLPGSERRWLAFRWALFVLLWIGLIVLPTWLRMSIGQFTDSLQEFSDHLKQARTHLHNREDDKALQAYTRAVSVIETRLSNTKGEELRKAFAVVYYERGNLYRMKGDCDRSITDYHEAIRLDNRLAEAYLGRSMAYRVKGNIAQADADYQEALRIKPALSRLRQP